LPRLGSEASAQDALAETYARVVERFDRFQWQSCGFYPWLRVVGLRIALDILRSKRRELLFEPDDLQREIDASETDLTNRGETVHGPESGGAAPGSTVGAAPGQAGLRPQAPAAESGSRAHPRQKETSR